MPGLTDAADQLTLIDAHAGPDARTERRQVQIRRLVAAGVADPDHAAGLARPFGGLDDAGCHGVDGRSERRAEVHAEMRTRRAVDRMKAVVREAGRHARIEVQRRPAKLPLQRSAVLVVEAGLAVGARRTESPSDRRRAERQDGGLDVAVSDELAGARRAVEQHLRLRRRAEDRS